MAIRKPSAIGFYPGLRKELLEALEKCFLHKLGPGKLPVNGKIGGPEKVIGGISPHAGYVYSGPIAANLYYELSKKPPPETIILLGPSHGQYVGVAVMDEGKWQTPLGEINIDENLAHNIQISAGRDEKGDSYIVADTWPHIHEHSLEVQIPFLQYIYGDKFKIVPITFGHIPLNRCVEIGCRISRVINANKNMIIASTDMTHYGSLYYGFSPVGDTDIGKILNWINKTDNGIIEAIKNLDADKIYSNAIKTTMCGYIPVTVLTSIASKFEAAKFSLLKYGTSYDVKGSKDAIVGYLSMLLTI